MLITTVSNYNIYKTKNTTFKSNEISYRQNIVTDYIKNVVEPLLDNNKDFIDRSNAVSATISDTLQSIYTQKKQIDNKYKDNYNLEEIPFVKQNLDIPLKYRANLQEYNYLTNNYKFYFLSEDDKNFAQNIKEEIHNPDFLKYKSVVKLFDNIKAGQKNHKVSFSPEFEKKIENYWQVREIVLKNSNTAKNLGLYKKYYDKTMNTGSKEEQDCMLQVLYKEIMNQSDSVTMFKNNIRYYTKKLQTAEKIISENYISEEEIKKEMKAYELAYQHSLSKAVNTLKKHLEKNPELKRNDAMNQKDDEFLKRQEYLNVKLWQHLQDEKKNFEDSYKRSELNSQIALSIYDDLPF